MLDGHFGGRKVVAVSGGNVTDVHVRIGNDLFEIAIGFLEIEVLGEFVSQALVVVLGNRVDLEQSDGQLATVSALKHPAFNRKTHLRFR